MPHGDMGNTMNKVSVGEPADGTFPYQGTYLALSRRIRAAAKGACSGRCMSHQAYELIGGIPNAFSLRKRRRSIGPDSTSLLHNAVNRETYAKTSLPPVVSLG